MKYTVLFLAALFCLPVQAQGDGASLQLSDCRIRAGDGYPGIKARCGTFERPENPDDPGSQKLSLRVAIVAALSLEPEPDPFVPIAGGPGQSTIEFYAGWASAFEKIRRERDILLIDQRGTGESAPMICDIDEDVLDGQFSAEQTIADTKECLDVLPHDPRFFTTSVAVRDLEALREALNYPQLNLYGVSYGSRVAQHYLRRYPDSTRSVILDGVVPPQLPLGPRIATEAQRALDAIFDRCKESAACDNRFPNVESEFAELKERLTIEAVEVSLANPITGANESVTMGAAELAGVIRLLSYHPNSIALLPLLVHEAARENYAPLAGQFLMIQESMSEAINIGMHNAVVCTEDYPFFGESSVAREDLEQTYIGVVQLDALAAMCSVWPQGPLDDGFNTPVASAKPVLLLSGEADPVTPSMFADMAAVDLENMRHLTGRRQGHGQAPRGCMPDIIGRFVASASVDDLDESCFERVFAMPFFLDFSGPSP